MQGKQNVLVTHPIPSDGLYELFEKYNCIYPEHGSPFTREELDHFLPEDIARAPRLKIISNFGAGYDKIDVNAADRAGIIVTNIPDATSESTAELAFALMLDVYRGISSLDAAIRSGRPEDTFGMGKNMKHNLRGSTLGILGMGRIGRRLCAMAQAFGMKVIYHNRHKIEEADENGASYRALDDLLRECDVLSINCPLTDETRGIVSRREIDLMKPTAVVINTSRGGTLDYDALCDAIRSKRIRGAGIDVYPDEPHIPQELIALQGVTLTPHVGTNTFEARYTMAQACAERIISVLSGHRPSNIVNRDIRGMRAELKD